MRWVSIVDLLTDLSVFQPLAQTNLKLYFLDDVELPHRYWPKLSDWQPEWLLDEEKAEILYVGKS